MGMLDRYKKKNGFIQLLTLIETSGKQKQEQFLNLIGQESKSWEMGIRKYMFSIDRILGWDVQYRAEIFSRVQPLTLSTVLHDMNPEQVDTMLSCMSISDKRKIVGMIGERNPTPAEKITCILKMISEVRGFSLGGIIKLEKTDPEMAIPENVEELLNQQHLNGPTSAEAMEKPVEEPKETLNFDGPKHDSPAAGRHNSEEIDFLKKKVNQLISENNSLKHDLSIFRNKLEQIKKIA